MAVCFDEQTCEGVVRLEQEDRKLCSQWLQQRLSNHTETESLLHTFGPMYWDVLVRPPVHVPVRTCRPPPPPACLCP